MIHHISEIKADSAGNARLLAFGDLQSDADGFLNEAFDQFMDEMKKPNTAALGLGDYGDWMRPTMRARLGVALSGDDSTRRQLDNMVRREQDKLLNKMRGLEGKLIGVHTGHHCHEFADGTNSDQRLACALKAPYLGWMATTRLLVKKHRTDDEKGAYAYTIVSTHGSCNSRKTGGAATWTEDNLVRAWIADQYILGHCCKGISWVPHERNLVRRRGPAGIETTLPRCLQVPGFHSGYAENGGYVERNAFPPQPAGWGEIKLKITSSKAAAALGGLKNPKSERLIIEQHVRYFEK